MGYLTSFPQNSSFLLLFVGKKLTRKGRQILIGVDIVVLKGGAKESSLGISLVYF